MSVEDEKKKVTEIALKLLEESRFAFLTTLDEKGIPHSRSMFNLRGKSFFPDIQAAMEPFKNGFTLFFSTNQSSQKYQQILNNPTACVLITRPDDFLGLTLNGTLEIIEDPQIKKAMWYEGSERYYYLGVTDPDYILLKLNPSSLEWWGSGMKSKFSL